jgi:hypothetical protein
MREVDIDLAGIGPDNVREISARFCGNTASLTMVQSTQPITDYICAMFTTSAPQIVG